nr:MAG TPA: hypothetical protein [Caudoviricetes sp.]
MFLLTYISLFLIMYSAVAAACKERIGHETGKVNY